VCVIQSITIICAGLLIDETANFVGDKLEVVLKKMPELGNLEA